jgi:hypothetical protein
MFGSGGKTGAVRRPEPMGQRMATRQIKMPRKDGSENDINEAPSQRQRPESGRYLQWLTLNRMLPLSAV